MRTKAIILPFFLSLISLTGCHSNHNLIKIVASERPHAEILNFAKPFLEAQGYGLNIEINNNYRQGNQLVSSAAVDANYFQHLLYFYAYNASASPRAQLCNAGPVHIEPIGVYSSHLKSVTSLQDGSVVVISDIQEDFPRIVRILANLNLVELVDDFSLTKSVDHPDKLIKKKEVDFSFRVTEGNELVAARENEEGDLFFINGNFALTYGLDFSEAIYTESVENNPYVNIVAVRRGEQESKKIRTLMDVLHSEPLINFIYETYYGAVVPVNEAGELV